MAERLLAQPPDQMTEVEPGVVVPLWRGTDGRLLALKADRSTGVEALRKNAPLSLRVVDAASVMTTACNTARAAASGARPNQRDSWADNQGCADSRQ